MSAATSDMKHPNRLRTFRKAAGKSQEQVAGHLGVSVKTVSAWETGRVELKADYLVELSTYLGCTPNDILGFNSRGQDEKLRVYEETYIELYDRLAPNVRDAFHTLLEATVKVRRPKAGGQTSGGE